MQKALQEYGAAEKMFPENEEMKYWHAVSLVNVGKVKEALPLFKAVFKKEPNYRELTRRIVPNGMLKASPEQLKMILAQ